MKSLRLARSFVLSRSLPRTCIASNSNVRRAPLEWFRNHATANEHYSSKSRNDDIVKSNTASGTPVLSLDGKGEAPHSWPPLGEKQAWKREAAFQIRPINTDTKINYEILMVQNRDPDRAHSKAQGHAPDECLLSTVWLRDNCQCSKCIHPDTRQREVDILSLPSQPRIADCKLSGSGIFIYWEDGHESHYTSAWLTRMLNIRAIHRDQLNASSPTMWESETFTEGYPEVNFNDIIKTDEGLKMWMLKIRKYGFCFVDECPVTPKASEALLERIGPIRNTHYGGFYDFTSNLSSRDTAYTNLALGLHTDNTYFTEPAGLQMFHLLSHTEGSGGASTLADGLWAAQKLKSFDPESYRILRDQKLIWHASGNEGISIVPSMVSSTIVEDPYDGRIIQIRWNHYDRATLDCDFSVGHGKITAWYDAARIFNKLLNEGSIELQMKPGKPLIFDNWRILHGRTAFTGKRRVCGGYISRDDFISRYKMTNVSSDQILQAPVV